MKLLTFLVCDTNWCSAFYIRCFAIVTATRDKSFGDKESNMMCSWHKTRSSTMSATTAFQSWILCQKMGKGSHWHSRASGFAPTAHHIVLLVPETFVTRSSSYCKAADIECWASIGITHQKGQQFHTFLTVKLFLCFDLQDLMWPEQSCHASNMLGIEALLKAACLEVLHQFTRSIIMVTLEFANNKECARALLAPLKEEEHLSGQPVD